jgi:hypothetical protein
MRRIVPRIFALLAALLVLAPNAFALNPEQTLTGLSNSSWYGGSLNQQWGENCSVLGNPSSEVMTSAIGGYGGTASVVGTNTPYWATLLVSTPGNPCGSGSAGVRTDLFLPPGTSIDASRPVRCFYLTRNEPDRTNGWIDGSNETWTMSGVGSGRICPSSAVPLGNNGYQVGFRPIPSGLMLRIFVPVVSTQALSGQPMDWQVDSTAAYESPGLTRTSTYVFAGVDASTPSVFFTRSPAAVPFWNASAPAGLRSRVEFFADINTANFSGKIIYDVYRLDGPSPERIWSSDPARPGQIPGEGPIVVGSGQGLVKVIVNPALPADTRALLTGPNGGYAPLAFDPPGTPGNTRGEWDVPMKVVWRFVRDAGGTYSGPEQSFRTLAGPDTDGDGVPDGVDACPNAKGNGSNGCAVVVTSADDDGDLDGVPRSADRCPEVQAPGTADGCPAPAPTATPVPGSGGGATTVLPQSQGGAPAPQGRLLAKPKSTISKAKLVAKSGATLTVQCTAGASVTVGLVATKAAAKLLKLKTNPLPTLATSKGVCAGGETRLKLTASKALSGKLKRTRAQLSATLTATVKNDAGTATAPPVGVKIK